MARPAQKDIDRRAYELWEKAGMPAGRDEEFYLQALQELQEALDGRSTLSGLPTAGALDRWDDVKVLKAHSKARTPVAKVSKLMKRSEGSPRQKARAIGIGF